MSRSGERRFDKLGEVRLMAEASGYVMARRPGCMPFVLTREEWDSMGTDYGYESAKWDRVPPGGG